MSDGSGATLRRLVASFADRDRPGGVPGARDLPIMVLWGSRGSACSRLLSELRQAEGWFGPRAFLDGEQLGSELRPYEIAAQLAFQFGQKAPRFGRVRFPRFFLGLWAVRHPPGAERTADARAANWEFIRRNLRDRTEVRVWLRAAAEATAALAGANSALTSVLGLGVDGTFQLGRTLALLRGTGMRWYRYRLGEHLPDPVDTLVALAQLHAQGDRQRVDQVLCAAFVADLRDELAGWFRFYAHRTSALALLDNVGTDAPRRFLDVLTDVLAEGQREDTVEPRSLLVVAASHRRFPSDAATAPVAWQAVELADASYADWAARRARGDTKPYYPVWVDPVDQVASTEGPTRPSVRAIADRLRLGPGYIPVVAFAHRLTAGHPTGLEWVLRALDVRVERPGPAGRRDPLGWRDPSGWRDPRGDGEARLGALDPRGVFNEIDEKGHRLDDAVFDLVLGPRDENVRRGLVLMAIAVDLSDTHLGPIWKDVDAGTENSINEFRAADLWVAHRVARGRRQPPRLHPFARRAITHRLAKPGGIQIGDQELSWNHAYELLLGRTDDAERVTRLYYELALGNYDHVVEHLAEAFGQVSTRDWYRMLVEIARAPLARPDACADVSALYGTLAGDATPSQEVRRRLLVALQLHYDPLADPQHDMCAVVANELNRLARFATDGAPFLLERANVFAECSRKWRQHGGNL